LTFARMIRLAGETPALPGRNAGSLRLSDCVLGGGRDNSPDYMNEWNIRSRAHACEACGQPFADQQPYHTLLFEQPPELRRSDICEPCSQKQSAGDTRNRAGFISLTNLGWSGASLMVTVAAIWMVWKVP